MVLVAYYPTTSNLDISSDNINMYMQHVYSQSNKVTKNKIWHT